MTRPIASEVLLQGLNGFVKVQGKVNSPHLCLSVKDIHLGERENLP